MPTDNNLAERIAAIRKRQQKRKEDIAKFGRQYIVGTITIDDIDVLIAHVEQLEREVAGLRQQVKDAKDDADAAAIESRWQSSQGEDYGSY